MSTSHRRDLSKKQNQLRAETVERLEAIVEAAERAAKNVIDDAEAQARQYLAQARAEADRMAEGQFSDLSNLIDTLLGQATSLRQEAERLQVTLEAARARIGGEGHFPEAPRVEQADEPRAPRLRAVSGEGEAPAPRSEHEDAAGARLLATQMAVSGSSREEIEAHLRNRFEVEDTKAILDAILGPED
jgi:cell division septum initiation protein DivIVA